MRFSVAHLTMREIPSSPDPRIIHAEFGNAK
jgi:hypothetical protein